MRMYEIDGEFFPSVTTVLQLVSTNRDLMKWANFMGFKRKDIGKILEESASFGTFIHSHIQEIVDPGSGTPIPPKDALEKYELDKVLRNFNRFFKDVKYETLHSEKKLVSKELGYGGTMDWVVSFNGSLKALLDFKTSKKPRPTMYLQLGGYYNLLQSIGIDVDVAGIIIINERECSLHPISKEVLEYNAKMFNILCDFYRGWENTPSTPDYSINDIIKNKEIIIESK